MSTLRVNTIQNQPGTGAPSIDGLAKAWVNFNGTGTVAIRAAYNVTSITDNGTGDYTLNFTTALQDANYSVGGTTGTSTQTGIKPTVFNTSSLRINTPLTNAALFDDQFNNVQIFR